MENYASLATPCRCNKIFKNQRPPAEMAPAPSWGQPHSPQLQGVADLPKPSWFTSIKDFNLIRSQPGQSIQRFHIYFRFTSNYIRQI